MPTASRVIRGGLTSLRSVVSTVVRQVPGLRAVARLVPRVSTPRRLVWLARALEFDHHVEGPMKSVHDFTVKTIEGQEKSLGDYAGKALLIVNVASRCGLTQQYAGLEELHEKYADR